MNRPLFRARNLDPSKRIRLLVDQHDDNNNTLTNPSSTSSSSSNNLLVSLSSTSNLQTSQQPTVSSSHLPQRCVPQMPFVSGMEREEEAVDYHMRIAFDTYTTNLPLFRSIIFKTRWTLKDDSVQQRCVLSQFLIFTKIPIVSRFIQQLFNYLNNLFAFNVYIKLK